jgi:pimeloyl-ACP methyl ester carboxylesterase
MNRSALFALIGVALPALIAAGPASARQAGADSASVEIAAAEIGVKKKGTVAVNGVDYYYEIRGKGEPLLLLHGGLGSIDMFAPLMPRFAADREVIGIDLHGHGRTTLGERPINLPAIADDLGEILKRLGYGQVDVLGYSFGGGVGLRLAVQHPERVRRLVIASAPFAQDGFFPEMLPQQAAVGAGMAEMMKGTPMYESYVAVAPRPGDFPRLLDRMGELMRIPYNWSAEVKTLKMPVMLIYGDSDMIRPEHIVEFYQLLGGGLKDAGWQREHMGRNRLAILPNLTHYEAFMSPALADAALPFLNGENKPPVWAEQVKQSN